MKYYHIVTDKIDSCMFTRQNNRKTTHKTVYRYSVQKEKK